MDGAGDVYVSGNSHFDDTHFDYVTVKYAANGNRAWTMRYNGPDNGDEDIWAMAVDAFGGTYVSGNSLGPGGDFVSATVKYVQGITLTSINPASAIAGGSSFTLTVNGFDFTSGAVVQWNGASRPTMFVNNRQLNAVIYASDIDSLENITTATVAVVNPGNAVSNPKVFTVVSSQVANFRSTIALNGQTVSVSDTPQEYGCRHPAIAC